jgi:anaerobic carbon-monoxide dehydrogenase iron sulfur subunit
MKRIITHAQRCTGCRLCESVCALFNEKVNDPSRSRIRIVKKHALGLSAPAVCHQCKKPSCAKVCPVEAIRKNGDGLVWIDQELCIGCEACVGACPFGMMISLSEKVTKCELCGGDPQCVKYCATGAIEYADAEHEAGEKRLRNIASLNLPSHPEE